MNTQIADCLFLSRAMGVPVPVGKDPLKWTRGALANPERRAAGIAHIGALLGQLPDEEDAARTPVEAEKRSAYPIDPAVRNGAGDAIGGWHGSAPMQQYVGLCPCESGKVFTSCHGFDGSAADSVASRSENAQGAA